MNNILSIPEAIELSKTLKKQGKTIVLTGGCFDILHIGHIRLLEEAKKQGDILFVFLESDKKIKDLKGQDRPIHTQEQRVKILSSIRFVDFVLALPYLTNDEDYAKLVEQIYPDIIAITENDKYTQQKQKQADKIGAKLIPVINTIPDVSTTRLAKILEREY